MSQKLISPRIRPAHVRTKLARVFAAQCLSTNTLMKAPTGTTRLLIKLIQNVTPLPSNAEAGVRCTG